jgi:FtsZ-binding cell division protein ZapB
LRKNKGTVSQQEQTIKKTRSELHELNEQYAYLNNDYREQNISFEALKSENSRMKGELLFLENRNVTSDISATAFTKVTDT